MGQLRKTRVLDVISIYLASLPLCLLFVMFPLPAGIIDVPAKVLVSNLGSIVAMFVFMATLPRGFDGGDWTSRSGVLQALVAIGISCALFWYVASMGQDTSAGTTHLGCIASLFAIIMFASPFGALLEIES